MTATQVTTTPSKGIAPPVLPNKYDPTVKLQAEYSIGLEGRYGRIIGQSPAIKSTLSRLDLICNHPNQCVPIVVNGETGVGKELVARAIHYNSVRSAQPFVKYNTANLGSELAESTLFGHTKGAYTDAKFATDGLFKSAGAGTLFLDEIGDLELSIQAKLLRVLESGEFYQVGSDTKHVFSGRIVVATNKDLGKLVSEGKFRADLFYRLGGIDVFMPPLRERREDIPLLVDHFLRNYDRAHNTKFSKANLDTGSIEEYEFPGNIRELGNIVEASVFFAKDETIVLSPQSSKKEPLSMEVLTPQRSAALDRLTQGLGPAELATAKVVLAQIYECHGNQSDIAQSLGWVRSSYRKRVANWVVHGVDINALYAEAKSQK